jgi:hypothetical protein
VLQLHPVRHGGQREGLVTFTFFAFLFIRPRVLGPGARFFGKDQSAGKIFLLFSYFEG